MSKSVSFFSLLLAVVFTPVARAMTDQTYGLGGTTTGRVSGVAAEPQNAFAPLLNPALIAANPKKQFSFALSWVNVALQNPVAVLTDNRRYRTRDGQERVGEATIPQTHTSLWSAGFTYPFSLSFWPNHHAGFGMSFSGPFDQFRRWISLSPYDFTPLRYGAADTQFKGTLAGSLELIPQHLYFGAGVSLFLTSAGAVEMSLTSANTQGRMAMDVGFNTGAIVGTYASFGSWGGALVYRQMVNPVFRQKFDGLIEAGGTDVANQPGEVESSLYFEPAVIEMELQKVLGGWVFSSGLAFQQWSRYQPSYLITTTRDAAGQVRSTVPPLTPMRDTFNPRASIEWRGLPHWRFSVGYQFRPSPIVDLSGPGNLLDSDTHVAGVSIERSFGNPLFFENLSLNLYAQAHWMRDRDVIKASPDYIGAPGYRIAGRGTVVGLSLCSQL